MKTLLWIALAGVFTLCILLVSVIRPGEVKSAPDARDLPARLDALEVKVAQLHTQLNEAKNTISSLQSALAVVQANKALDLGPYVSVATGKINHVTGPHVIFTGANVHIRDGSGFTNDNIPQGGGTLRGLGNLIVGYNEVGFNAEGLEFTDEERAGSHNIVVGPLHRFMRFGGFVAGLANIVSGDYASVTGGIQNTASGHESSISGGGGNKATGQVSSVSGGERSVAGGDASSVSGGTENRAAGQVSSVSGGLRNVASGERSSVTGGTENIANGQLSSVSGGSSRSAVNSYNWAAGGLLEPN